MSHRTEHVSFRDDRSVVRRVTVEFHVPEQAPVFRGDDGQSYSLVPLSVVRRKTLVNFELRDDEGRSVVLPALRQNQAITESMLLACADAALEHGSGKTGAGDVSRREIADFVHQVVSGDQQELTAAYETLARGAAAPAVLGLVKQSMFKAILDRLANNFVLWVMIPAGAPAAQGRGSRPGGHVTGLCDDAYGTYNFNWGYYLESLRLFAETGAGKPFQARVNQRNGGYRAGRPVN